MLHLFDPTLKLNDEEYTAPGIATHNAGSAVWFCEDNNSTVHWLLRQSARRHSADDTELTETRRIHQPTVRATVQGACVPSWNPRALGVHAALQPSTRAENLARPAKTLCVVCWPDYWMRHRRLMLIFFKAILSMRGLEKDKIFKTICAQEPNYYRVIQRT